MFDTELLTETREQLTKLASLDPELLRDAERYALAEFGAAVSSLGGLIEAVSLDALDAAGTVEADHGLSTARWHANQTRIPCSEAKRSITVGHRLRCRFSAVRDAVRCGRMSFAQARYLTEAANPRVVDDLAAVQDHLIDSAAHAPQYERWTRDLRDTINRIDEDGGYDPNRDPARNRLKVSRLPDGLVKFDGTLTDELGLGFAHLLETEADRAYRAAIQAHEVDPTIDIPRRSQLLAEAAASLVRRGAATDPGTTQAPRAEVILIINARDLTTGSTIDGHPVSPGTLRLLLDDAVLHPVVVDGNGNPLYAGRTIRLANATQRRALAARDGGCVFAGCDAQPSWSDAHHVIPWEDGGPTDLDNLALLCRRHHGKVHSTGYHMATDGHGRFTITHPDGHTRPTQHRQPRE